jgi:hypothetical protein
MSVYKLLVVKDDLLSAEYRVTCAEAGEPGYVLLRGDGTEEDLTTTEGEADAIFERQLHDFVMLSLADEGDFITTSAVSDGGGVVRVSCSSCRTSPTVADARRLSPRT